MVRAGHDRCRGRHRLLHACHGLGRLGRVNARQALHSVRRREVSNQRADAAAGRRAADGRAADMGRLRRGRRRRRDRRAGRATRRGGTGAADRRSGYQPLFGLHRSAGRSARAVQMAQSRSAAARRAGRSRACRLVRTPCRRLGAGWTFYAGLFGWQKRNRRCRAASISCSPPEER